MTYIVSAGALNSALAYSLPCCNTFTTRSNCMQCCTAYYFSFNGV